MAVNTSKPVSTTIRPSSLLGFSLGSISTLLLLWAISSHTSPPSIHQTPVDPPDPTFYDDPTLAYTIGRPVQSWDSKRASWMATHPTLANGARERVLILTGSQPTTCQNPDGDNFLLRLFKNKVDYARLHRMEIFYNNAHLHPKMDSYWAKIPVIRAAMVAHPETEWIWWVDSDAVFTDMEFELPLGRYHNHNLVAHGWGDMIYKKKSWTSLNAGVFLIRNCQWSMDFLEVWADMGPQSPNYKKWGRVQKETLKDKLYPGSDDQSALIYLILTGRETWATKIYLEGSYHFESYWLGMVDRYENMTGKYSEMEMRSSRLKRRRAERVNGYYGGLREEFLESFPDWRRPLITHFTGCQPCSGDHNPIYEGRSCWRGLESALNFGDNQVLRNYGYVRRDLHHSLSISPLPFGFPAAA